jgi:hypothetical protein
MALSRWWIASIRTISSWNSQRPTAHRVGRDSSVFIYGGLPGEPAFGPPAFMHRMSAMDSPEAPLTHHWFDSTHITFGVLTAGVTHGDWKFEASRFRGREPDEDRYDIETANWIQARCASVGTRPKMFAASVLGGHHLARSA